MAAKGAVCICLQSACDSGLVNEAVAAAAELRVRKVASAVPDLMISKAGCTLAFLLWRRHGGGPGGCNGAGGEALLARCKRLASAFKQAFVLVPHQLLGDMLTLNAVARLGCEESLSFVFMPMGAEFTERAVALATALLPAQVEEAKWRVQQSQTVETSEAVTQALLGLPLPADGDAAHHANMLRMLGSLQDISERRVDEIAAHTDIHSHAAAAIAAFFQRGARRPDPLPYGLAFGPQLQSL